MAGVGGLWVGRRIDAVGPRDVMTAGSVLGVVSVFAVAGAGSLPWFFGAWILAGAAMSATLYAPAFAAITGWTGPDARHRVRALTAVTPVAGLASTVFAPLTALLLGLLDWRGTYAVLGVVFSATVAGHWWGLRAPWPAPPGGARAAGAEGDAAADQGQAAFRRSDFWLLVAAMTLAGFCVHAAQPSY